MNYQLGKLPNMRAGFYHVHSGMTECGMPYRIENGTINACKLYVNHDGKCGYADNTPY